VTAVKNETTVALQEEKTCGWIFPLLGFGDVLANLAITSRATHKWTSQLDSGGQKGPDRTLEEVLIVLTVLVSVRLFYLSVASSTYEPQDLRLPTLQLPPPNKLSSARILISGNHPSTLLNKTLSHERLLESCQTGWRTNMPIWEKKAMGSVI